MSNKAGAALQEWSDDFDLLTYRPTGTTTGVVLNASHEPPHLWAVDFAEPDCECQYMAQQGGDGKVCKHLAKAMLAHPDFTETSELLVRDMSAIVDRAATAAREVEGMRDQIRTARNADAQQALVSGGEPDADSGDESELDPRGQLRSKLAGLGLDPDDFKVWVDDEYGSLQFEIDSRLSDDDYNTFTSWATSDGNPVKWDRENRRNFIKKDDFGEVLA